MTSRPASREPACARPVIPASKDSEGAVGLSVPCEPPMTEAWLRETGHVLAADERARQRRMASAALDQLLARRAA
jgi:hypothetical protein